MATFSNNRGIDLTSYDLDGIHPSVTILIDFDAEDSNTGYEHFLHCMMEVELKPDTEFDGEDTEWTCIGVKMIMPDGYGDTNSMYLGKEAPICSSFTHHAAIEAEVNDLTAQAKRYYEED